MRNYSKDDFTNKFKSRFDMDNLGEEGWSIPPDSVFENALKAIDEQKRSSKRFLWFLLLLPLLGGLVFIGTYYSNDQDLTLENENLIISQLTEAKVQNDQSYKGLNKEIEPKLKKADLKYDISNINTSIEIPEVNSASKTIVRNPSTHLLKTQRAHSTSSPVVTEKILFKKDQVVSKKEIPVHAKNSKKVLNKSKLNAVEFLEAVQINDFLIENRELDFVFAESKNKKTSRSEDSKFSIIVALKNNLSSFSMEPTDLGSDASLIYYDKNYYGLGLDLSIAYAINKNFSVLANSSFAQINNESQLDQSLYYSKSNEFLDSEGNSYYQSDMDLITPLGSRNSAFDFHVDPEHTTENELISAKTSINQQLQVLNFGLSGRYQWTVGQKFETYLASGLSLNYIFDLENNMETEIVMDKKPMGHFSESSKDMGSLRKTYFNYTVESGILWPISSKTKLIFSLQYKHSLQSLRKANLDNIQLNVEQFELGIGTQIRF